MGLPGKQTDMEVSTQEFDYSQEQHLQRKGQTPAGQKEKSSCDLVSANATGSSEAGGGPSEWP